MLKHFLPSDKALPPTSARTYSIIFLADMSCSEISSRRLPVNRSLIRLALASFLTKAESEMVMATTGQHDTSGTQIDAVRPSSSFGRGRGAGKINRKGARKVAGRGGS